MRFKNPVAIVLIAIFVTPTFGAGPVPGNIKSLKRLEDTVVRHGGDGDNWLMSWTNDDRLVAGLCDGNAEPWKNVPHKLWNSRLISITGEPPKFTFDDVPGYPELLVGPGPRNVSRYYGFGILALDGAIYQFMSTPDRPFDLNAPHPKFVGAKLIYSPDNGKTWHNQDRSTPVVWEPWEDRSQKNMVFFNEPGDAFALISVMQMGRNYEHNKDGYVYLYTPNGSTEGTMNQVALARVPKDKILDRSSYEFFVKRKDDDSAEWSKDINAKGVVVTYPTGYVNSKVHPYAWQPSVTYNAPLGVYLMSSWGMGLKPDGEWFGKPSYLGFWAAKNPWGPWTQIHEEKEWKPAGDAKAHAYQPQIMPKGISADGKSFWMVWTDFQFVGPQRPYYSFNMQRVEIVTD